MERRRRTYILLTLSVVWAVIIFVLCTMPSSGLPQLNIPHSDKIAHFGFFLVQSALLSLLLNFRTRMSYARIVFLSTLMAFVYGGFIEILQVCFFNRTGELYDLIADVLGGLLGAMAYPVILRLFQKW